MATEKKTNNRKRTADEAEIYETDKNDVKRMKLSKENKDKEEINNDNDPFALFAKQSTGFSTLLETEKNTEKKKEKEKENEIYSFGSFESWSDNKNGFGSFQNDNNTKKEKTNNDFKFDSNTSQFTMDEITSNSNSKRNNNDNNNNDNNNNNNNNNNDKPVALLKGEIDSGDKMDITVFALKCIVYELDSKNNCYKEKGIGDVKLNKYSFQNDKTNNKINARLLCRKDVTFKTLINGIIQKDTEFSKINEKNVRFTVFEQLNQNDQNDENDEEEDDDLITVQTKTYLLKSKETDKKKINVFLSTIKEIQQQM